MVRVGVAKIAVLPPGLASQIAAGEVVERPASAVKELVENAVDAGARRCDVEIEGGGVTLIRVRDDGTGMAEEDARLAIERHATSKLQAIEDLKRVASFGFRGEALPSIASVSRFTLRTRTEAADAGVEVEVEGTKLPVARPVGMAVGTEVEVRDLFFNVPARRKFLRSTGTESGHVTDALEGLALARPEVTFTLHRDRRRVREWLRTTTREERVRNTTEDPLVACVETRGPLVVEAYLSRPDRARTGAGGLKLLVNGRTVRDRAVLATIAQSYGSVLERGRYPRGVVYLDLPPELVDVNVHPQKAEVRFADPRAVTDALYGVLSRQLAAALSVPVPARSAWGSPRRDPAPDVRPPEDPGSRSTATTSQEAHAPVGAAGEPPSSSTAVAPPAAAAHVHREPVPHQNSESETGGREPLLAVRDSAASRVHPGPEVAWKHLRFVAQVRQTYLICEGDEGLYVIDQHAASERVHFSKLRKGYRDGTVASQSLLFPLPVEVTAIEAGLVEEHADAIASVGLEVRVRGPASLSVHAVPQLLRNASPERLVRDLLNEVTKSGGRGFSDAIDLALAKMACHGAVRAGDSLTRESATALVVALDEADFAGYCAHGRPVVAFTPWTELERKVGRR